MPHIKKMVMHGFKSFATKTEIQVENSMNVIVGPNGSGKSNITDALCFVLGRLSIKSIRAAKAANLIFSGNKHHKPSQEASVELVFDNEDKTFPLDNKEIHIKRTVRRNGQSIYKINHETKTRQELVELLAQAGVDPHGFNIVLQGEIASLIKLSPEDRRKIIEEVAGISIYETRKTKSLKELDKAEEKLNEVSAVLRERNNYLRQLEKDRQEALNFKKLEQTIKKCKATILSKGIREKQKEIESQNILIKEQEKEVQKMKNQIQEKQNKIQELEGKISKINKQIQDSTSHEQETLHRKIADLKAEVAGLEVKKDNFETRIDQNQERQLQIEQKIEQTEDEIIKIKKTPKLKKQHEEIKNLQQQFDELEKQRRRFYQIKSELSTLENQKQEKQNSSIEYKNQLKIIQLSILELAEQIKHAKSPNQATELKNQTSQEIQKTKSQITDTELEIIEIEKSNAIQNQQISSQEKLKSDIPNLEVCPLCKNKITQEHRKEVITDANGKIIKAEEKLKQNQKNQPALQETLQQSKSELSKLELKLNEIIFDTHKLETAEDKKKEIKKINSLEKQNQEELEELTKKTQTTRTAFESLKNIEEKYDDSRLKLQELHLQQDISTETSLKQRELNRLKTEFKALSRDLDDSEIELKQINQNLRKKQELVSKKEDEEQELYEKFQQYFTQKNQLQDEQKAIETQIIGFQHQTQAHQDKVNTYNIQKAQLKAQHETLDDEFKEYENIELLQLPLEQVKERLQKCQLRITQLGSVNLRAVEVYETVKEQCQQIQEKVETIQKEKTQIMKIIEEIDKKKKKSFVKTLEAVNTYFTRNFTQLSKKGEVFLDLEDKQDPFSAGLNIILKVARGKYFDVSSLSGGEKTLVALSLIFAIQEYKPYCFYVFDEIDAALDKHNSELLAALIKKYMTSGQYIVVTHNDALISEATTLYGVSMQENISKVISLKI